MARRPRHRRKDMRDAMKKKAPDAEAPEEGAAEEDELDDVDEAATKSLPRDRVEKAIRAAEQAQAEAPTDLDLPVAERPDPKPAPQAAGEKVKKIKKAKPAAAKEPGDGDGDDGDEDEKDGGPKRGRRPKKKRRKRRRSPSREEADEAAGLAEGFGVVTAIIGGTFAVVSLVILLKSVDLQGDELLGKPHYWWILGQGVGAALAYTWLAVSGGGLSARWWWTKTSINATAGFLVALAALDTVLRWLATSGAETAEGDPLSTSVIFWAAAWGMYPLICLLFMNVPGLVGDVRLERPPAREPEEPEEPDEEAPEDEQPQDVVAEPDDEEDEEDEEDDKT